MEQSKRQNLFSNKSESLNDMIINYYHRFGKNRDLEKYLRFRRHYTGFKQHSSSESSLLSNLSNRHHCYQLSGDHDEQASSKSLGSLEHLLSIKNSTNNSSKHISFATGAVGSGDGDEDSKKGSHNSCTVKENTGTDEEEANEILTGRQRITIENFNNSPPKINIKNIKRQIECNNKKGFSFNCESNIEITIPSFPVQPATVSMPNLLAANSDILAITEGSQTDFDEIAKLIASTDKLSVVSEVNEEGLKTPKKNIAHNSTAKSISPDSNIKSSIHKRLEWDSLGDVGYNTTDKTATKDKQKSSSISTLEKSVLKDFFAERGFALSFPGLTSKSANNQNKSLDNSFSQGAIPKKPIEEKWRKTLASVQQKYYSSPTLLNRQNAICESVDTDVSPDKTNFSLKNLSSNRHSTQIESLPIGNLEQFCQTSLVKTECREVQCDFSNGGSMKSAFEIGSMTSQSSFEYYSKTNTSDSNKENVPFKLKAASSYSEDSRKKKSKKSSEQKETSPRKSASGNDKKNEVELGIQLLCSLIEAKNLNDRQKKILIKKIIAKIANRNIESLNSITVTETSQSYNNSTSSKASSIITSALITSLDKKKTENTTNNEEKTNFTTRNSKLIDKSCITSPSLMDRGKKLSDKKIEQDEIPINKKESNLNKDSCKSSCEEQSEKIKENLKTNEKPVKKESLRTRRTFTETSGDVSQTSPELITMREWLDPITKSEFSYEKKIKKLKNLNESGKFKFFDQQKKKHFYWIEKEIKRLENLKNVLRIENDSTTLTSSIKDSSNLEEENSKMLYGEKRLYDRVASQRFRETPYSNSIQNNYISPYNNYDAPIITNDLPANFRKDTNRYPPKFSCNCRRSYLYDEVNPYTERKNYPRETRFQDESSSRYRSKLETPTSSNHDNDCLLHALKKRREFIERYVNQQPSHTQESLAYALQRKREFIDKYLDLQEKYEVQQTHSNPKEALPIQQNSTNMNYPSTSYASSPSMSIRFATGGTENSKQMRPSSSNQSPYKKDRSQSCCETVDPRSFLSSSTHNKNASTLQDRNNFINKSDLTAAARKTFDYCNNNLDAETKKKSIAYIITFKNDSNSNNKKSFQKKNKNSNDVRRSVSSPPYINDTGEKDMSSKCAVVNNEEQDNSTKDSIMRDNNSTEICSSSRQLSGGTISEEIEHPPLCNETTKNQSSLPNCISQSTSCDREEIEHPPFCNENTKNQSTLHNSISKSTSCDITINDDDQHLPEIQSNKCVKINCECKAHKKKGKRSKSKEPVRRNSDAHITIEIITRKASCSSLKQASTDKSKSQISIEPIVPSYPENASKQPSAVCIEPITSPRSNGLSKKQSTSDVCKNDVNKKRSTSNARKNDVSKKQSTNNACKEKSTTQVFSEKEPLPCDVSKKQSTNNACKEKSTTQVCSEKEPLPCGVENNDTSNDCSNMCRDECSEPVIVTPNGGKKKKKKNEPNKKCPCKDKKTCYCKEVNSNEYVTLQDHYKNNCPDFFAKAMERQSKLKELQKLRKERSELMHQIVENHSCTTIFKKLKQLPPPAATQIKVFTSREKQAMTKRKHRNLPEIIEKCEVLRRERQKCGNQILQGIFNQRMQKRVRQGKLTLQPSRTII